MSVILKEFLKAASQAVQRGDDEVSSPFGVHGITYHYDEESRLYGVVGFVLPVGDVWAEIDDGTFGELQGFRFYADTEAARRWRDNSGELALSVTYEEDLPDEIQDPAYFQEGLVATVRLGTKVVTIHREGVALLLGTSGCRELQLRTPMQFRAKFPNGSLPEERDFNAGGWHWENNGWFQLCDTDGDLLDDPCYYKLGEAVHSAVESVQGIRR